MFVDTTADGTDPGGVVCAIEQLKRPRTFHPSGVRVGRRRVLQTFNHSVVATPHFGEVPSTRRIP